MIKKRFMTKKVFLADIKPVPLQMRTANDAAWRGGKWRKMSDYVAALWRFLSDYVADYGGFCRTMWRKMADFVGLVADYGNGKKDGYGIFSILNGKTPRRIS